MIQEAKYTSPSGKEIIFSWETAKRDTELKTGVYTFPGSDGAHVQHQGMGARSFPLVCIFSGPDCTDKADIFEAALIERGIAELQHPIYGAIKVKPVGHIEREDDPVKKLWQSTVTVTFTETIDGETTAELNEAAAADIDEKYEDFSEAAASDFAVALETENITEQIEITAALETQTQAIIENLEPIASSDKNAFPNWLSTARELKDKIKDLYSQAKKTAAQIDSLYTKALNIGRLTLRLIKLPSDLSIALAEKIKGYSNLTANLINQYKNDPLGIKKIKNAYASAALALTGAGAAIASGSALSVAEVAALTGAVPAGAARASIGFTASAGGAADKSAGTASREEAVEAANTLANFYEAITAFQDTKIAQNAFVDSASAAHIAFTELVYSSIQLILNAAFALPMQKTITLDRDRQVIELCAEIYGTTDYLDDFIIENNFNINEIELLPMGKKASYYVKNA